MEDRRSTSAGVCKGAVERCHIGRFGDGPVRLHSRGGGSGTEARFAFDSFPNTVGGGGVEAYSIQTPVSGGSSMEIVYWSAGAALQVHLDAAVRGAAGPGRVRQPGLHAVPLDLDQRALHLAPADQVGARGPGAANANCARVFPAYVQRTR